MTTLDITNEDNRTAARRVKVYALSRVCVCVCVKPDILNYTVGVLSVSLSRRKYLILKTKQIN